ncbi:MAG: TIM44-like domain-containing protein [Planctomycetota bacterium]|nr:TIM44-like domain-containing protein [Planctomycetota bacterium]
MTRNRRLVIVAALALALPGARAWARGGGGCLEEGTSVLTPSGAVNIERLRPGDEVLAPTGRGLAVATVRGVVKVQPTEYVELHSPGGVVRVTEEHPIATGAGRFQTAGTLQAGQTVLAWDGTNPQAVTVSLVRRVPARAPAYNLLVGAGGVYVANGLVVHNKGCFLPDTPVLRADGARVAIRDVRPGDELLSFRADGTIVTARVRNVLTAEVDEYVVVTTDRVELRVTAEHPFYVGAGAFQTVGSLAIGERVYAHDGQRGLASQRIVAMRTVRAPTTVYNLQTEEPNTFFADGVAVHNKGGGGGGGGGHSGGGGGGFHSSGGGGSGGSFDSCCTGIVILIVILVVITKIIPLFTGKSKAEQDLDYVYSPSAVAGKAAKTLKLLEFIARTDGDFAPQALTDRAQGVFIKLQECWQGREYEPMRPLLMADLFAAHLQQIEGLKRQHEIDHIEGLAVRRIDIVNVRYTHAKDQREFTALVTASARDYYTDDRTGAFLRGDRGVATFQEFWTFQWQGKGWLLREIEQSRESDALKEENFFEPFTDHGVEQVYGDQAGQAGPAGPWLEKAAATKAVRIERLLNFLAATDKMWTRQAMLERAREVFTKVYLAQEAGDPAGVPAADVFPEVAQSLREVLTKRRADGVSVEYRNLCVRKVELILVRNFADNAKDEYTVRISAHALQVVQSAGGVVRQDEDVAPFEEYWTFGRLERQWRLKEVLPSAAGEKALGEENLDEDSTPAQLQWYYRQTRAV